MKYLIILSLALFFSLTSYSQSKRDTIKTVATFIEPFEGRVVTDYVFKTYKDTVRLAEIGATGTFRKVTSKDTIYFVPTITPMMDASKKPMLDSLGRQRNQLQWIPVTPRNIVWDFNKKF